MTTITINNQELEFSFKFKQVKQLVNQLGKNIEDFEEIVKNLNNVVPIGAIGTGKTEEEIEELIDADGSFNAVKQILEAFTNEVIIFFSPNLQSQAN